MLTEKRIRDAKPCGKLTYLWDGEVKGLAVRITKAGAKAYVLRYRVGGRQRIATIARTSEIALSEARLLAGSELVAIRAGESDPLDRHEAARTAPTVNDAIDRFVRETCPARIAVGRMAQRTLTSTGAAQTGTFARDWAAARSPALVSKMSRPRLRACRDQRATGCWPYLSRVLNLCETWEWRNQHTNPVRGVEKAVEQPRDRTLTPDELAALGTALAGMAYQQQPAVAALLTAALTGLRISEVLGMQWRHIDFDARLLTIPASKTGKRTQVLNSPVVELLARVPRFDSYVFAGGRSYKVVRRVFIVATAKAGIGDATIHDLRRTVMTNAAASGIGVHVLRDLLGHKTTAIADQYIRRTGSALVDATEQSGAAMAAMLNGKKGAGLVPVHK